MSATSSGSVSGGSSPRSIPRCTALVVEARRVALRAAMRAPKLSVALHGRHDLRHGPARRGLGQQLDEAASNRPQIVCDVARVGRGRRRERDAASRGHHEVDLARVPAIDRRLPNASANGDLFNREAVDPGVSEDLERGVEDRPVSRLTARSSRPAYDLLADHVRTGSGSLGTPAESPGSSASDAVPRAAAYSACWASTSAARARAGSHSATAIAPMSAAPAPT